MANEHELKYMSSETMVEGVIVEVTDGSVVIDIKGRLGQLRIPMRMIISNYDVKVGQEVGFLLSYPEVFDEAPNEHYVKALHEQNKIIRERKEANKAES